MSEAIQRWRSERQSAVRALQELAGTQAVAALRALLTAERELLKEQLVGDEGEVALRTQGAIRRIGALLAEIAPTKPSRETRDGAYTV